MILRGIKTVEYRSRATRIIGERFYLYAAGKWPTRRAKPAAKAWSLDLAMPAEGDGSATLPPWMAELASALRLFTHELPTGVIVGSAVIEKVSKREDGMYQWHLAGVQRAKRLHKPAGHPQPVWFTPF